MGIKSTRIVSRKWAIDRINMVDDLAKNKKYKSLDDASFEDEDTKVKIFVDSYVSFIPEDLNEWTNEMLGKQLDNPFFRESMFDNHRVTEDGNGPEW